MGIVVIVLTCRREMGGGVKGLREFDVLYGVCVRVCVLNGRFSKDGCLLVHGRYWGDFCFYCTQVSRWCLFFLVLSLVCLSFLLIFFC